MATSRKVMGILRIHVGKAYAHAGKNRRSLCLKNTGSFMIVKASSEKPLNIIMMSVKKIAPMKIPPSSTVCRGISVRKNNVIVIKANRVS